MIRITSSTLFALAFLPIALILILVGINAIGVKRKNGILLKLALTVNASLVMILGFLGISGEASADEVEEPIMCYMMVNTDMTQIEDKFESSADWQALENSLITMEGYIRSEHFDNDIADELYANMKTSIANLQSGGLISEDDASVILAYIGSRHEFYSTNVGHVRCYDMAVIPPGKETTKKEIAETTVILRQLYEEGKLGDDSYNTALATLEEKLKLYTDKEDNAVLRQLLLDLADGRSGAFF